MDKLDTNSTDDQCIQHELPKTSTELSQSQQTINSKPSVVWNVMAKTQDCSPHDKVHNTDETTDVSKLPQEPVKCSSPEQIAEHFSENCLQSSEIPSAPCETTLTTHQKAHSNANTFLTTHQKAHSNANTFHSSQTGFPQTLSSMETPMQLTSQQHYMEALPSSQQQWMGALTSSQQHCMSAGQQHYIGGLLSSQQHYTPSLPASQQHFIAPLPPWHSNAQRYSAPHPMAGWEMMPPPCQSQADRPTSTGLQPKGNTAQPTKRPGININIRVGKCAHDVGTTEKFSTCGICCCLLIPIIGCIFCMKSKDVVCAKCDKVIGKASREKKIAQGKCAHDGGTEEKFSKCGVCCCLLIPIIGCIFCSKSKNLVCVKCDKVVGKVSKEKVKNIDEECEKPKVKAKKKRKTKNRKEKLSPNKDKKKLIRKVSHKRKTDLEGEISAAD